MAVNFNAGAASASLELAADSGDAARAQRSALRWDRKRKKMVHVDPVWTIHTSYTPRENTTANNSLKHD